MMRPGRSSASSPATGEGFATRDPRDRARLALEGLSLGDAFGERFFGSDDELTRSRIARRELPAGLWRWTDDTAMATCVVGELVAHDTIDPDRLAPSFARRYTAEPARGYGGGAHRVLGAIGDGIPWAKAARMSFADGSRGNGAAMRSAPIGAFFGLDVVAVTREATASAVPTHAHPDAIDGAVAVALAAGYAAERSGDHRQSELLSFVLGALRHGVIADGLRRALGVSGTDPVAAARTLGSGQWVLAEDTVPFALWCADRHLDSMAEALWATVAGLGDRDTTCAMVGGIVAGAVGPGGLPVEWLAHREPLPMVRGRDGYGRPEAGTVMAGPLGGGPGVAATARPHARTSGAALSAVLPRIDGRTRLLVLTGAGISADSGLAPVNNSSGLWDGHAIADIATPGGFERDPDLVWAFYSARRAAARAASPNVAHHALVDLEHLLGDGFLLVTQNVDGLHPRAGSRRGVEVHGSLWRTRCSRCGLQPFADKSFPVGPPTPRCHVCPDGRLRPDVVWFGEPLDPRLTRRVETFVREAASSGERFVFLAIGTSGLVDPVASWAGGARAAGAETWCVALEPPANDSAFDHVVVGPAVEIVPAIVANAAD